VPEALDHFNVYRIEIRVSTRGCELMQSQGFHRSSPTVIWTQPTKPASLSIFPFEELESMPGIGPTRAAAIEGSILRHSAAPAHSPRTRTHRPSIPPRTGQVTSTRSSPSLGDSVRLPMTRTSKPPAARGATRGSRASSSGIRAAGPQDSSRSRRPPSSETTAGASPACATVPRGSPRRRGKGRRSSGECAKGRPTAIGRDQPAPHRSLPICQG